MWLFDVAEGRLLLVPIANLLLSRFIGFRHLKIISLQNIESPSFYSLFYFILMFPSNNSALLTQRNVQQTKLLYYLASLYFRDLFSSLFKTMGGKVSNNKLYNLMKIYFSD